MGNEQLCNFARNNRKKSAAATTTSETPTVESERRRERKKTKTGLISKLQYTQKKAIHIECIASTLGLCFSLCFNHSFCLRTRIRTSKKKKLGYCWRCWWLVCSSSSSRSRSFTSLPHSAWFYFDAAAELFFSPVSLIWYFLPIFSFSSLILFR